MFRDFEKAPSKSSYQLKYILAALALIALMAAWIGRSNTGHNLASTQLERDRVAGILDERSLELEGAERNITNLRSEQAGLEETIAASEAELEELRSQLAENNNKSAETQSLLSSATDSNSSLEEDVAELLSLIHISEPTRPY